MKNEKRASPGNAFKRMKKLKSVHLIVGVTVVQDKPLEYCQYQFFTRYFSFQCDGYG